MNKIHLIASVAAILILQSCISDGMGDMGRLSKTYEYAKNALFSCPSGCEDTIERWGLYGYSRYCVEDGEKQGKWMAFEDSAIVIEGEYNKGVKDGKWKWYNSDGTIYRIIEYKNGNEVADIIVND